MGLSPGFEVQAVEDLTSPAGLRVFIIQNYIHPNSQRRRLT